MLAMSSHATRRGPHGKNVPIPRVQRAAYGPSFEKQPGAILIEPRIGSLLQERPRVSRLRVSYGLVPVRAWDVSIYGACTCLKA